MEAISDPHRPRAPPRPQTVLVLATEGSTLPTNSVHSFRVLYFRSGDSVGSRAITRKKSAARAGLGIAFIIAHRYALFFFFSFGGAFVRYIQWYVWVLLMRVGVF